MNTTLQTPTSPATATAPETTSHADGDMQLLQELRRTYDALAAQVAAMAEQPLSAMSDASEAVTKSAREQIRAAPLTSVALATLGGVALAVLLTSGTRKPPSLADRARTYADAMMHLDVNPALDRVARATEFARSNAADMAGGLIPNIEKLAASLSRIDTGGSVKGAIEHAVDWVRSTVSGAARS